MYDYIKSLYGTVFTDDDLPAFVAAGWITAEQAAKLETAA